MIGIDLDGTLLGCRDRQVALMRHAARSLGGGLEPESYWRAKRGGASNRTALAAQGIAPEVVAAMCALWEREIERWPWLGFDHPLPHAEDALRLAADHQTPLHLITARGSAVQVRLQIERLGWKERFATINVVSPLDVRRAKAAVLLARGCRCMIGDTEADAGAALVAGLPALLVTSGMRDAEALHDCKPDSVHSNVLQALELALAPT